MKKRVQPDKTAAVCMREFSDRIAKHAAQFAFNAVLDISDKQHSGLGGVALLQASAGAAREAGTLAGRVAVLELITSGLASALARAARSHASKKAGLSVQRRRGGKKAQWKESGKALLKRRRNLDVSTDELIEFLVQGLVIDRADEGFECHQTGDRIAKDKKNLASEISKLKADVLKTRASAGK